MYKYSGPFNKAVTSSESKKGDIPVISNKKVDNGSWDDEDEEEVNVIKLNNNPRDKESPSLSYNSVTIPPKYTGLFSLSIYSPSPCYLFLFLSFSLSLFPSFSLFFSLYHSIALPSIHVLQHVCMCMYVCMYVCMYIYILLSI